MLKATKSVIRSEVARASRLAEAMGEIVEIVGAAVRDAAIALGAQPSPQLVPIRVRARRPTAAR